MNNTTYSVKKNEIERKWYIIDATDKPLGRVATEAARLLRGKHKPTFTPNIDTGDNVIIINCKDAKLTGNKMNSKIYRHHSGYIGGMKETQEMVDYCAKNNVLPEIQIIKAQEVNQAWKNVEDKKARYRYVIDTATI